MDETSENSSLAEKSVKKKSQAENPKVTQILIKFWFRFQFSVKNLADIGSETAVTGPGQRWRVRDSGDGSGTAKTAPAAQIMKGKKVKLNF